MHDTKYVVGRIAAMRHRARERDERQRQITAMRDNDYDAIAPGLLPEEFDKPLVANLIDTAAHDLAEVMAPLPTVSCASASQTSEAKKAFANKRSLIANSYIQRSRLGDQMYLGADRYGTFGYMVYTIEPDYDESVPTIRVSDSTTSYWAEDYRARIVQYAEVMKVAADEVCHRFPDFAEAIKQHVAAKQTNDVEVALWLDKDIQQWVLPELNITLTHRPNPISRVPVRVVKRPTLRGGAEVKGQFDDVIWVQYARALVAAYTMNAIDKAVNAPTVVPDDVQTMEFGPDAVIQTANPAGVGKVNLNIPSGLFPQSQSLDQQQREGSRYPEGRSGSIDASIVTGQGVQALMGTFDTQVQTFQRLNESALSDVLSMCFEMDEALWPTLERSVRVRDAGSPVEITYRPDKDIKGDHSVDVSYGAVAGLDPNRSLIFLLQAVSGGFMSRETARKFMPVDIDHVAETKRMDLETVQESMVASLAALAQAIPQMAANGQDPREVVEQMSEVLRLREKGKSIAEAIALVYAPKEDKKAQEQAVPSPEEQALAALAAAQGGGDPAAAGGGMPAAPMSPGQDLLMGLAGISPSGTPNLQANVSSRQPI